MENSSSAAPIFETDDATYVLETLPAYELFEGSVQAGEQVVNHSNPFYISIVGELSEFTNQVSSEASSLSPRG